MSTGLIYRLPLTTMDPKLSFGWFLLSLKPTLLHTLGDPTLVPASHCTHYNFDNTFITSTMSHYMVAKDQTNKRVTATQNNLILASASTEPKMVELGKKVLGRVQVFTGEKHEDAKEWLEEFERIVATN